MAFEMKTNAFQASGDIPSKFTCDGEDRSPELKWSGAPEKTQSFALICDDPDAPVGLFTHWVLYGLASEVQSLPEGLPKDADVKSPACKQGVNDFRKTGYGGPCPPRGSKHRYYFKLFALDTELSLPSKASRKDVEKAMEGHILAETQLMGTYARK
jgi:Raf kinase inhibitor-like YbhB/YbcL family protein